MRRKGRQYLSADLAVGMSLGVDVDVPLARLKLSGLIWGQGRLPLSGLSIGPPCLINQTRTGAFLPGTSWPPESGTLNDMGAACTNPGQTAEAVRAMAITTSVRRDSASFMFASSRGGSSQRHSLHRIDGGNIYLAALPGKGSSRKTPRRFDVQFFVTISRSLK
jgi:hypothetical protein